EPRRLERYAHIPQRAIRVSDHGPLHRRWVANRTADATSICPQIARSPRQSDPPDAQNPQKLAETCRGAGYAQLPSPTQNWQHCTDVCERAYGAGTHTPCPLDGLRRMGPCLRRDDRVVRRERETPGPVAVSADFELVM